MMLLFVQMVHHYLKVPLFSLFLLTQQCRLRIAHLNEGRTLEKVRDAHPSGLSVYIQGRLMVRKAYPTGLGLPIEGGLPSYRHPPDFAPGPVKLMRMGRKKPRPDIYAWPLILLFASTIRQLLPTGGFRAILEASVRYH